MHGHGSAYPYEHEWADHQTYLMHPLNIFEGLWIRAPSNMHCHGTALENLPTYRSVTFTASNPNSLCS